MSNNLVTEPIYNVYGYINDFRQHKENGKELWFAQVSLIVGKSKDNNKHFKFQNASLLVVGTAKQLIQLHDSAEGAKLAWCKDEQDKAKLLNFQIKGYYAESTDKNKSGIDIKGRIFSIDTLEDEDA
jgi:hypothetical protein